MRDEQVVAICLQECSNLYGWGDWKRVVKDLEEIYPTEKMDKLDSKRNKDIKAGRMMKYSDEWEDPVMPITTTGRLTSAILVRKPYASIHNYHKSYTKVTSVYLKIDQTRAVFGARLHGFDHRRPLYLFCCHVPYHKTINQEEECYIKNILEGCSACSKSEHLSNWMCVGDFNYKLRDNLLDHPFNDIAHIRRPNRLTTKANEYDYSFVNGQNLLDLCCTVHIDQVNLSDHSDHYPIHYLFSPIGQATYHSADLNSKLAAPSNNYSLYWKEKCKMY